MVLTRNKEKQMEQKIESQIGTGSIWGLYMGYRLRAEILTNIMLGSYLGPLYPTYTRGLGASQTTYRL